MFNKIPKPDGKDGFDFSLEQDSLADSMGTRLPNRSLLMIQGEVGSGKSLVSQRLIYGLLDKGAKVLVVTTELTTRGWIEQMASINYPVQDYLSEGKLMIFSRFGVIAEAKDGIDLMDVLESESVQKSDVVVIDSSSALMPQESNPTQHVELLQKLRKICSDSRSILLTVDPEEMDPKLIHKLRTSCEVLLDLNAKFEGGDLKRTIVVTRFLRALFTVQPSIGWRVEPDMGFIVDITAVS